jgi:bifunctional non-homologous end joining protein LigD
MLGNLISRVIEEERKDIATTARAFSARGGRVYLDYLQNRHGQLLVAPFSVRPLPGAPVSMPLSWAEVGRKLDPKTFTIKTASKRMAKVKNDPLQDVLKLKPDLGQALARLGERVRKKT